MPLTPNTNFSNLFHTSARLGALLGALKLPWEKVASYVTMFSEELNDYQELSLNENATELGIMTTGKGKSFAFRVARYMEDHGIKEECLKKFLVRAKYFEYSSLFFKIEIDFNGPFEFSYAFRNRQPLDIAYAWLASSGAGDREMSELSHFARALEKSSVHFLAAAERLSGKSYEKIYFTQPEDDDALRRIHAAGELIGLNDKTWAPLVPYKKEFKNKTLFMSLVYTEGKRRPGAKLDIRNVIPDTVYELMRKTGQKKEAINRTQLLLNLYKKKNQYDYLGLHLHPEKEITTKVYLYHQK